MTFSSVPGGDAAGIARAFAYAAAVPTVVLMVVNLALSEEPRAVAPDSSLTKREKNLFIANLLFSKQTV